MLWDCDTRNDDSLKIQASEWSALESSFVSEFIESVDLSTSPKIAALQELMVQLNRSHLKLALKWASWRLMECI